jgi:O-methyltransferase
MKLFLVRYTKIVFTWLRLHVLFNWMSSLFSNLYYLTKFSKWVSANRKIAFNDFPSKWDYNKRYDLYKWVIEKEGLANTPINYLEFGVASGYSFRWFVQQNTNAGSRFHGFDTFTGLPEDWGPYKKGAFGTENKVPEINDPRIKFHQGIFQQTLPGSLNEIDSDRKNVVMMDADLYSATLYALTTLAPVLKKGDIIFFDEFAVPTHEFKAFRDFVQSYYFQLELIAAANNYYFTAFKVV